MVLHLQMHICHLQGEMKFLQAPIMLMVLERLAYLRLITCVGGQLIKWIDYTQQMLLMPHQIITSYSSTMEPSLKPHLHQFHLGTPLPVHPSLIANLVCRSLHRQGEMKFLQVSCMLILTCLVEADSLHMREIHQVDKLCST
jgi:hypothetical protein